MLFIIIIHPIKYTCVSEATLLFYLFQVIPVIRGMKLFCFCVALFGGMPSHLVTFFQAMVFTKKE